MAKSKTLVPVPKPNPALIKAKAEGLRRVKTLEEEVQELQVTDQQTYEMADVLLGDISRARKEWAAKLRPIYDPLDVTIQSAQAAKRGVQALDREVDTPLATMEIAIKGTMARWRLSEDNRLAEEKRLADAKQAELTRQLEETVQRAAAAPSKSVQKRLEAKAEALAEQLVDAEPEPEVKPQATHSVAKKVKRWRVTDPMAALRGITAGVVPADIVIWDPGAIQAHFRAEGGVEAVGSWPGFEAYDDVQIARKG